MSKLQTGVVSVILVNYRGAADTVEAIANLKLCDWPAARLEIVVVDNASGDDSLEVLRRAAPDVTIVDSPKNLGFAGGCNLGASRSSGEVLAFLNNDARPDPAWISAAVDRFSASRVGAVASRVLDWEGERVDYVGAGLTWFGMGYKPLTGEPEPPKRGTDVLFGTGSAMFVKRAVFDQLGGFDERFFMFFEDVDFGWRLNLAGWRFVYEPASLAFHKHHASMGGVGAFREQYLLERNALFTLYKNLDDDHLDRALPAAMALAIRRGVAKGALDSSALDLRHRGEEEEEMTAVAKITMASVYAIDQFVEQLDSLVSDRHRIQSTRLVGDARIWSLFGDTDMPAYGDQSYLRGYDALTRAFETVGAHRLTKVLLVTGDPLGRKLAGPAIRVWHMAQLLSREHDVHVVTMAGLEEVDAPFRTSHIPPGADRRFDALERWADVIIFQGHAMAVFSALKRTTKILVVDVYDPMHLEQLEQARGLGDAVWVKQVSDATSVMNEQLARGDFFLCASQRQRHFYLGQLAALGRVNPANYRGDPDLTGLIAVAPFGLDAQPPLHDRDALKGVLPGIEREDKVLLWSGGLYNWFDPKTLIRAVAQLGSRRPGIKLFFQGTKHPHPGVPEMAVVAESRVLAASLGILGRSVFFNDSWVDYADRQNYLMEADAGVSTHFAHVETTFSFRTRILDYLWAGIPIVVTEGDYFAELIERERLGVVVRAEDPEELAAALERVLWDQEFIAEVRENVARVREEFFWERALAPLTDFLAQPHRAADRGGAFDDRSSSDGRGTMLAIPVRRAGMRHDLRQSLFYLVNGGPAVVAAKIRRRFRRT